MPRYEFIILGAMAFSFSSPFEQYFDHDVTIKQVDVPTQTGAVGILPIHVPTLGCLAPGSYALFHSIQLHVHFRCYERLHR